LPALLEHPRGLCGRERRLVRQAKGFKVACPQGQRERNSLARRNGRQS